MLKKKFNSIVLIATLIFIILILGKKFEVIKASFLEHKLEFLLIAFIYLAGRYLDGMKLHVLLRRHDVKIKRNECFGLSVMMAFYNLFLPNAGIVTNAVYLRSKYGFGYTKFLSTGLIRSVAAVFTCGLVGLAGSLVYMAEHGTPVLLVPVVIYVCAMAVSVAVFFVPIPGFLNRYGVFTRISEAIKDIKSVKVDRRLIYSLAAIQMGINLAFILRYYVVFTALSYEVSFLNVAAIIPITELSNMVNLIPSNMGIRETVVSVSSLLIGFSVAEGFMVAAIDRAVVVSTALVSGMFFFVRLRYSHNLFAEKEVVEVCAESEDV
ncbi:MAG: flippase-like domain-containing protein [Candidatus Omnitrophica bacterium]|nr:flippase-like domain-containing protein [Candidatus Omnitrophota bacterium]